MSHYGDINKSAAFVVELMKLLRVEWMTADAIAGETSTSPTTVHRWLREMVINGLILEREAPRGVAEGERQMAKLYALAATWGGVVA